MRASAQARRHARGKLQQPCGDAGTEASREFLGDVFLLRVIDDVLGLDDLARHVVEAAERIGQSQLDAAAAAPDQTPKNLPRLFEALAPALAHRDRKSVV